MTFHYHTIRDLIENWQITNVVKTLQRQRGFGSELKSDLFYNGYKGCKGYDVWSISAPVRPVFEFGEVCCALVDDQQTNTFINVTIVFGGYGAIIYKSNRIDVVSCSLDC